MKSKGEDEELDELGDLLDEADTPLTLVLPGAKGISKKAIAEDGSVAFRMIKKGPLHQIIYNLKKPLVSTSANLSGALSPTGFHNVSEEIKSGVDIIAEIDTSQILMNHITKLRLNV